MFEFQNGDILFIKLPLSLWKPMSWWSAFIRNQERDFEYEHVCEVYLLGSVPNVFSTGVGGPPFYNFGVQSVSSYLKGKEFAVGRISQESPDQLQTRRKNAMQLLGSPYAWWKVLGLDLQASVTTGEVKKLGFGRPNLDPKLVFCAAAVARGLFRANLLTDLKDDKLEPDACSPKWIYDLPNVEIIFKGKQE